MSDIVGIHRCNESLILAVVYDDSCEASMNLVDTWKRSVEELVRIQAVEYIHLKLPKFATIPSSAIDQVLLKNAFVSKIPTVLFFKKRSDTVGSQSEFSVLEYRGLDTTRNEMVLGLTHHITRLQYSCCEAATPQVPEYANLDCDIDTLNVHVQSVNELEVVLKKHQDSMLQRVPAPLDPLLSTTEHEWVHFIMGDRNQADPFRAICQCRQSGNVEEQNGDDLKSRFAEFDQIARVLSRRRDVVFCVEYECSEPGVVSRYHILANDWSLHHVETYDSALSENERYSSVAEFSQKALRPTILWLDRQLTAPIAFAPFYKLHVLLFVDFHHPEAKEKMRGAVAEFRQQCQLHHDDDCVCLVVPSTDKRFLSSFGVDMWTQLDHKIGVEARQKRSTPIEEFFPSVAVTDQRGGVGVKRFYLEKHFRNHSLADMLNAVMSNETEGGLKSPSGTIPQNSYGVYLLTDMTIDTFVGKKGKSKLLLFYSPTCGHCKRFNVVWNALAEFIDSVGLSEKVQVGRLDVAGNEYSLLNVRVQNLPEVYFFGFDGLSRSSSRYDHGQGVGAISDPLDIIEWWVDIAKNEKTAGQQIDEYSVLEILERSKS
eukprot:scaffold6712_cov142-Cylindrotheca_fusiformis.AAC.5